MTPEVIAIDFDGTVVDHRYPDVGSDVPCAVDTIRELVDNRHKIILWTMRSGQELDAAVQWYADRKIPLFGVNTNPSQFIWTTSPKAYAYLYIDDAALGCPLMASPTSNRSFVDWAEVREMLFHKGLLPTSKRFPDPNDLAAADAEDFR